MGDELRILVAEDDATEVLLLKRAFSKAGVSAPVHFVQDGQEAIDYLKGDQPFEDRATHPLPSLLLLDLKMPRLNGFNVIEWVRRQTGLRRLLIVIFSSSAQVDDINRAYDLGANSYLVKPYEFGQLQSVARSLESYWFGLNRCAERLTE